MAIHPIRLYNYTLTLIVRTKARIIVGITIISVYFSSGLFKIKSMQTKSVKTYYCKTSLQFFGGLIIMLEIISCGKKNSVENNVISDKQISQQTVYEETRAYVKYRSFQNSDSTWGFTIFVNSRPFLLYKKIPVDKAKFGFVSRKDAEKVAGIFVKMINNGNMKPSIDLKGLDTLGIIIRNRKVPG